LVKSLKIQIWIVKLYKVITMQNLQSTISTALNEFHLITKSRKKELACLTQFIQKQGGFADLIFICTHNSRRSHLSQVWAQVAAQHFGFFGVHCYSGGTEATAFYPSAIQALEYHGLHIIPLSNNNNPVYAVSYNENQHPIICFSKTFDHEFNPQKNIAAIMTCDHADQNCPFIPSASVRIPIRYDDPKIADGTEKELEKYIERSAQICREMFYAFSLL